jgi:drug/metabolite transporter (DMT)-like permease
VRLKTLLGLIIGNLIWSAHPAMSKLVLADFTPAEGAWLRYTSALVAFLLFRAFLPQTVIKTREEPFFFPKTTRDWLTVAITGGMCFCFAPLLQLTGLNHSRATDNALIIAMEPMMTVLMAWLFLKQAISLSYAGMFFVALLGVALLAGVSFGGLELGRAHVFANFLMLISLLGEASYSVGCSQLFVRHSPISIFGMAILSGVIFLTISVFLIFGENPIQILTIAVHQMTWKSATALAWLGPMGTAASYLYWMYALKEAPVASVALTLFVQPVFGAFWGYVFLSERLTGSQFLGGALIIVAVFAQTLDSIRRARVGEFASEPGI